MPARFSRHLCVSITMAPNSAVNPPSMTSAAKAPGLACTSSRIADQQEPARVDDPCMQLGRDRRGCLHHFGQPAMQRERPPVFRAAARTRSAAPKWPASGKTALSCPMPSGHHIDRAKSLPTALARPAPAPDRPRPRLGRTWSPRAGPLPGRYRTAAIAATPRQWR